MTKSNSQSDASVCLRQFSDGRRCRMLRKRGHPSLCVFHAREEQQLTEKDKLASELASLGARGIIDSAEVARVITKIFNALARNRISPRSAATLGYLGQLLLQSLDKHRPLKSRPYTDPAPWSR